jgi:hypothetical protein
MEPSPLREWVKAVPFVPFAVTLSSGRVVHVPGPEMVLLGRLRDVVGFVDEEGYDRHVVIYHNHVASVDQYDPMQSTSMPG